MSMDRSIKEKSYFNYRNVRYEDYKNYIIPNYLRNILPKIKKAMILDIGCGFGHLMSALNQAGYINVHGVDISDEAILYGEKHKLNITKIENIIDFARLSNHKYDFIIMSHVLEHMKKSTIIETLQAIKRYLLKEGSLFLVTVPNAQSNTGSYWAYEDFTHTTIFTAGSLCYVLKAAGFETVEFIDLDCTEGMPLIKKIIRKFFLTLYKTNKQFWNKVTSGSYHRPSPQVFSYEIKALAR